MAVNRDEFIQVIKNALHKAENDIETNIPHDLRNYIYNRRKEPPI